MLLDAGEGSWGSLVHMYGHKAAIDQVLHQDFPHFVTLKHNSAFGINITLHVLQDCMLACGRMR